jgi:hypothetical protein
MSARVFVNWAEIISETTGRISIKFRMLTLRYKLSENFNFV